MKIMAVICEYNPFHNGHAYQLKRQREELGCDAVVCLMSGHFVQRGEPALCDKWARAEMALSSGCDLVLELPGVYALSSAEGFAGGGVSLLAALGLEGYLAFGSETAQPEQLSAVAELGLDKDFNAAVRQQLETGVSYPQAYNEAAERLLGKDAAAVLANPNDVLGIEYIRAIKRTGAKLLPAVLRREKGQHDSHVAEDGFLSATGIRRRLAHGEDVSAYMPEAAYQILQRECRAGRAPVFPEAVSPLLCYALTRMDAGELRDISGVSEGLEMRIKQAAAENRSFSDLAESIKTKRYPKTRINRILMKALLGVTKKDEALRPAYARILGIGEKGREVLRQLQQTTSIPLVTKAADASFADAYAQRMFSVDLLATDIYTLLYPEPKNGKNGLDFYRPPVITTF